jgi:hypothetical protein
MRRFILPLLAASLLTGSTFAAVSRAPASSSDPSAEALTAAPPGPGGAAELALADDLSFVDDSSAYFPIRGRNMEDRRIASDRPTLVFFGTAHCWNTNREAERLVAVYPRVKDRVRFVIVDLERAPAEQRSLVRRLYRGAIPTVAILDRHGEVVYDAAGETATRRGDTARLESLLAQALERR